MTSPPAATSSGILRMRVLAFAWGFAEATFFFIVPDVLLTRLALRDLRAALRSALWATAGAVPGGILLWLIAQEHVVPLLTFFDYLPGVSRAMIGETGRAISAHGAVALFGGAWQGQPYKLFAAHAGAQHVALGSFILVSLMARLARFTGTSLLAWGFGRGLAAWSERARLRLHAIVWLAFYAFYFALIR